MQPVQDSFFLRQTCELHTLCALRARLGGELVVAFDETRADHEDVAGFDAAALGLGADVKALEFRAGVEVGEGDGVRRVGVVGDVVGIGVVAIVEKDGAASDAMGGPVVDAAFKVGVCAVDVGGFCLQSH